MDAPNLQNSIVTVDDIEFVSSVENGTAIWAVVALNVETGRVWFGEEEARVALGGESATQEVEVINFL